MFQLDYSNKDFSILLEGIKNDFQFSDEDLFLLKQRNDYVAFAWVAGKADLKTRFSQKYEIFALGTEEKEISYTKSGRLALENIKFNKFMIIYKQDEKGKFPSIDLKEYVSILIKEKIIDPKLLEFSLGYDVMNSSPIVIKLYGGEGEGFQPNYIGQPRSGKGINMRSLIYQLRMFPMSEFLIFDKSKDLLSVHQAKKTIFQMDIEEISSKPSRLTNFFIYLFIYYQNKASLLNKFGFIDYKDYYKAFLKQEKEGISPGDKKLPVIPYTIIIYDEIKRQRANYIDKGGDKDVFDNLIGSFLNTAPFAGFKMIGATQEPNISTMGSGFKALKNIFFRIVYDLKDGISLINNRILNSDKVFAARLMNYKDIWIKPPFAKDGNSIDDYLKESMNGESLLKEAHYSSINELLKSLASENSDSVLLNSYKFILTKIGFIEKEIEEIENSDEFFIYITLAFYIYRTFSIKQLKPTLPIKQGTMTFDNIIDSTLFNAFMPLVTKDKEDTIKKVILGQINDTDEESANTFFQAFGKMMHGWYELEIKKSGTNELYGFQELHIPLKTNERKVENNELKLSGSNELFGMEIKKEEIISSNQDKESLLNEESIEIIEETIKDCLNKKFSEKDEINNESEGKDKIIDDELGFLDNINIDEEMKKKDSPFYIGN